MAAHTSATCGDKNLDERQELEGWGSAAGRASTNSDRVERGEGRNGEQDERADGTRHREVTTRKSARRTGGSVFELPDGTDDIGDERAIRIVIVGDMQGRIRRTEPVEAPAGHSSGGVAARYAPDDDTRHRREGERDDDERGEARQRQTHGL
jgi:hypothetical protein